MLVRDVMSPDCQTCTTDTTAVQAAQFMADHDIGSLPVAREDRLVGMITDRDLVTRGIAGRADLNTATAGELMSESTYYCFDDQDCEEVAQNMGNLQVRRLPVVNRDKSLVGMVSLGDLSTRGPQLEAGQALTEISAAS